MADILLIGAGKSATVLIDFLAKESLQKKLETTIVDANNEVLIEKTQKYPNLKTSVFSVFDEEQRQKLVQNHKVIISLLPPHLHIEIAKECIQQKKHLLTASYIDDQAKKLATQIKANNLIFLYEMGLDPGIDHMSAMEIIDHLKEQGANIISFKSHCGGLIAKRFVDNPLSYKFSWNPANVINAGKAGAKYLFDNKIIEKKYEEVFNNSEKIEFEKETFQFYPNRDSLSYIETYNLKECKDFVRTTLRYEPFLDIWQKVVELGLTTEDEIIEHTHLDYTTQLIKKLGYSSNEEYFKVNKNLHEFLEFLGLLNPKPIPVKTRRNLLLQQQMEKTMNMQVSDKDRVVMIHEIEYKKDNKNFKITSCLDCEGENNLHTAMAKTVGLPLGIAAVLILENKIKLNGLQIPIHKDIYSLVLPKLKEFGISFTEKTVELS